VLSVVGDDDATTAVALYLEGIRDGRRFVEEVSRVARVKPVIALKVGGSEAGQRAVTSHTGALAGEDAVYEAALLRAGVIRVTRTDELFEVASALSSQRIPEGDRVAILTNAGGPGVAATDAVVRNGLVMATLSKESLAALNQILPEAATKANPVDMLASASKEQYKEALSILLSDSQVDSVMVILPPPPHFPPDEAVEVMEPVIASSHKPVIMTLMGGTSVADASLRMHKAGIPCFTFPEQSARALAALSHRRAIASAQDHEGADRSEAIDLGGIAPSLADETGFLRPDLAGDIAAACGIDVAPLVFGHDLNGVSRIADELGYPVAVKVASKDVVHKTDVGGIRLGIGSSDELADVAEELIGEVHQSLPQATLEGLIIQPMQPAGIDVVVGAVRDPQFGPVVMFGSGGVSVELDNDTTFDLAPVTRREAHKMIRSTRVGHRMISPRGPHSYDIDAVADVIYRISELIAQVREIDEFEINPLRVFEEGSGVVAIDVRCRMR
jgi:acetyltransferase